MARAMVGGTRRANARLRVPRPSASRAKTPTVRPALAGPRGVRINNGATGRAVRASSGVAPATPNRVINRPKTSRPSGRINLNPRADGVSKI